MLCALSLSLLAQIAPPGGQGSTPAAPPFEAEAWREEVEAIVRTALSSGQAYDMLARLVAAAPKRLAGSPGDPLAISWAEDEMERSGLANVRLEPVRVPRWERGEVERLAWVAEGSSELLLSVTALGGSVGTPPEGLEAEVVEVRSRQELEALGERARGRFVFFNQPMDPTLPDPFQAYGRAAWQRMRGAAEAARRGGVGAIVRSLTTRLDDHPHTGAMRYEEGLPPVPAVAISTRAAEELSRRLASGAPGRLRLWLSCRTLEEASSANVVGELVGREAPEEILLVGGHLDAWETGVGAHDDGAGCVQSIEAARLLLACGLQPRRTIRVVLFANEENGLAGARAYRQKHEQELARHVLALESDSGGFAPRGFETDVDPSALPTLRAMASLLAPIGADRVETGRGGADISVLADHGVPLFGYVPDPQRYFDVHHSALDTLDSVHPRELELGAAAIAALLYLAAELPEPLPRSLPPPQTR